MAQLTLAGRSDDGHRLLLVDDAGREFTLVVDARLQAALRGDDARTGPFPSGQLEIPMESTLRPRDIQSRIRAGETPDAVAQAASTTVDKIMPFAAPVLAERAHVAERAQLASVRRRGNDSGARTLGEAVAAQLREHNVDPATVQWDAWRREDGRWTLTGAFATGTRSGTAAFSFDARGNFVTVDDEDARWLVGDDVAPASAVTEVAVDDISAARARRLSSVPPDELPLGDDAIEMVTDADRSAEAPHPAAEADDTTEIDQVEESAAAPAPAPDEQPAPRPAKKRGRASVPSWDEIMFGGGKGE